MGSTDGAKKKALVLCSGGVDSTTLLALAVERYGAENVYALSIFYGPFYAGHDVAVLRAAGCRADERGGGLAAALRRFYVVRQAQFEQQDQ